MTRLRLAYGRIAQETNALSPVPTTIADFEQGVLMEGEALAAACSATGDEAPGFTRNAELSGFVRSVERARARHGIEAVFDDLLGRLVERLRRAGTLDGVFLSLHGALGVTGVRDPESVILEAVREATSGKPLTVTHDLHGNLTSRRVAAADAIVAYRTNPHRDHVKVGEEAGDLLVRTAAGRIRPMSAWRSLPMLVGGGTTLDFLPPMVGAYARMRAMRRDPRVLATSFYGCHMWNDDPELGWSSHVTTDGDQALAEELD